MKRRRFVGFALASVAPCATYPQLSKKIVRLGWLEPGTPALSATRVKAFQDGLRALGRIEGENIVTESRYAAGKLELFPAFAEELVRMKPDCVVAAGVDAIRALTRITATIPIVMGTIDVDPVREGIVASLARPGGNVTGLTGIGWELAAKRLELLKELLPRASRIAVLFDPRSPASLAHVEVTRSAAAKLGVQLQLLEARDPEGIDRAFKMARDARAEAISLISLGLMRSQLPRVVKLALESGLPAIYVSTEFVTGGGLIAYSPDLIDQFRRAAVFVDKILKGAKPADLPIEQPTKFDLVLNMKTAKALGITFPQTILMRAERVIE